MLKKITFLFLILVLSSLISCEKPIDTPALKLEYITAQTAELEQNNITVFEFKVHDASSDKQRVSFTFDSDIIHIKYNGDELMDGESIFTSATTNNTFAVIGVTPGTTNIKMTIADNDKISTLDYNITVLSPAAYKLKLLNAPDRYIAGQAYKTDWLIESTIGTDPKDQKFTINVNMLQGKGVVYIGSRIAWNNITPGFKPVTMENCAYNLGGMFISTEVGTCEVEYIITSSGGEVSKSVIKYYVDKSLSTHKIVNTSKNNHHVVGRRDSYDFEIRTLDDKISEYAKYSIAVKIINGKGVVHTGAEMVWCDTIPNFTPITRDQMPYNIGGMYTPLEIGTHDLEYTIKDKDGNISKSVMSFKVDSTVFDPVLTGWSDKVDIGQKILSLQFNINHFKYTNSQYYVRMKGFATKCALSNGTQIVYNTDIDAKLPVSFTNAVNGGDRERGILLTTLFLEGGNDVIYSGTIYVGDSWGREYSFNVTTTCGTPKLELSAKPSDTAGASAWELSRYDLNLSLSNYNASYTPDKFYITFLPVTGCEDVAVLDEYLKPLEWNKEIQIPMSEPAGGNRLNLISAFNMKYGATWGEKVWNIKLRDSFGGVAIYRQTVNVTENPFRFTTTANLHQDVVLGKNWGQWNFKASLDRDGESKLSKYKMRVTSNKKGSLNIVEIGDLELNKDFEVTKKDFHLKYIPLESGQHNVVVYAELSDGRKVQHELVVNATYPIPTAELFTARAQLTEGEAHFVEATLRQNGFTGKFKYKILFVKGSGQLSYKGQVITPNTLVEAPAVTDGQVIFKLDYDCKGYNGDLQIEIIAEGADGMSATARSMVMNVRGTQPTIGVAVASEISTQKVVIPVKIDKLNYNGNKLKVNYQIMNDMLNIGTGTIDVVNNKDYGVGTYNYTYTASVYGLTKIKFTVTDEFGRTSNKIITFNVNPIKYKVNLPYNNAEAEIYRYEPVTYGNETSFTFEVGVDGDTDLVNLNWTSSSNILRPDWDGSQMAELYFDGKKLIAEDSFKITQGTHKFTIKHVSKRQDITIEDQVEVTLSTKGAAKTFIFNGF